MDPKMGQAKAEVRTWTKWSCVSNRVDLPQILIGSSDLRENWPGNKVIATICEGGGKETWKCLQRWRSGQLAKLWLRQQGALTRRQRVVQHKVAWSQLGGQKHSALSSLRGWAERLTRPLPGPETHHKNNTTGVSSSVAGSPERVLFWKTWNTWWHQATWLMICSEAPKRWLYN